MKLPEVFRCLFLTFQIKLVTSILKQFNPSYHNKCQTHWHSRRANSRRKLGFSSRQKPESPELNTSAVLFPAEKTIKHGHLKHALSCFSSEEHFSYLPPASPPSLWYLLPAAIACPAPSSATLKPKMSHPAINRSLANT